MTMSSSSRPVPGFPTQSVKVPPRYMTLSALGVFLCRRKLERYIYGDADALCSLVHCAGYDHDSESSSSNRGMQVSFAVIDVPKSLSLLAVLFLRIGGGLFPTLSRRELLMAIFP